MLKDRKALLENDLGALKKSAANMYLSMVVSGTSANPEYHRLKELIASLEFDLAAVNTLISQGHP